MLHTAVDGMVEMTGGGTGPDVGCDGVCFSGLVEDM